jgi:hypothetical protein
MFINADLMNIRVILAEEEAFMLPGKRAHKHFQLDSMKIKCAQKLLGARTETETIERALDLTIAEYRRNRRLHEANNRFLNSGIQIKDVYGRMND